MFKKNDCYFFPYLLISRQYLPVCLLVAAFLLVDKVAAQSGSGPAIQEMTASKGWIIRTPASAYQIIIEENGAVKPAYYGAAAGASSNGRTASWFTGVEEVPVRGGYPGKTPMLEVVFHDQVRDLDLTFVSGEILSIGGHPALKIVQKDRYYPLQVESFIRVIAHADVLEKWCVIKNTGSKHPIRIENFQSGNLVLPADQYTLTHLAGKWGHEYQLQETNLSPGTKTLQAVDFKSFANPPWFLLRPQGEADPFAGPAWYGSIQYSGNWRMDFNQFYDRNVQVTAGIHFWDTWYNLKPGASYETPKFITGYTDQGSEKAAQNLSAYVRTELLPVRYRETVRPVLYNSWYATNFDVNEKQQLALAHEAKEMGVELFVIDDGWFKGRINDRAGLGDWEVDPVKFPNGLSPMIRQINDMGMDFGIWIEPEMTNPDSDLYRAHPDWVFYFPNRKRHESRNQLMLNLAREDVYQYLLKSISKLLQENNIKFIKWDHNRTLSEPGWPDAPAATQREVRLRYIDNLYRLVDELKKRFPDVWFETCSSGGGRADYGMLARMDQAWASDNTDPVSRLFIQHGYLSLLPANTMVSWVTHENWYQETDLGFKFDVCMSGVLGIGNDLTKWTGEEKKLAAQKIALYKQVRPLVQQGIATRLVSPFQENRSAVQYTATDGLSAVLFCYNMAHYLEQSKLDSRSSKVLRLQGLQRDKSYRLTQPGKEGEGEVYSGAFLMDVGIGWPVRGSFKSQVLLLAEEK